MSNGSGSNSHAYYSLYTTPYNADTPLYSVQNCPGKRVHIKRAALYTDEKSKHIFSKKFGLSLDFCPDVLDIFYNLNMRASLIGQTFEPAIKDWDDVDIANAKLRYTSDPSLNVLTGSSAKSPVLNVIPVKIRVPPIAPNFMHYHRQIYLEYFGKGLDESQVGVFNTDKDIDKMLHFYHEANDLSLTRQHVGIMSENTYLKFATWFIKRHPNKDFLFDRSSTVLKSHHGTNFASYWLMLKSTPLQEWLGRVILRVDSLGIPKYFSSAISRVDFKRNPHKWTDDVAASQRVHLGLLLGITQWLWAILTLSCMIFIMELSRHFNLNTGKFSKLVKKQKKIMITLSVSWVLIVLLVVSMATYATYPRNKDAENESYCFGQLQHFHLFIYNGLGEEMQRFFLLLIPPENAFYIDELDLLILITPQRKVIMIKQTGNVLEAHTLL